MQLKHKYNINEKIRRSDKCISIYCFYHIVGYVVEQRSIIFFITRLHAKLYRAICWYIVISSSICPSVTLRYCFKTARRIESPTLFNTLEILSDFRVISRFWEATTDKRMKVDP